MAFLYAARNFAAYGKPYLSAPSGPCVCSSPDPDYPATNAVDKHVSPPARWLNPATAPYTIDASTNVVGCGDMEQAGLPGWSGVSVQQDSLNPFRGASAMALSGDFATQLVTVTAGQDWKFHAATFGTSTVVSVIDAERGGGYYLDSAGDWNTGTGATVQGTMDDWEDGEVLFTTPFFRTDWNRPTGLLKVELTGGSTGGEDPVLYDEVYLAPGVDVFALVGHNFPPGATMSMMTDPDYWHGGMSFSTVATASTMRFPVAWYVHGTTLFDPFWRVQVEFEQTGVAPRQPVVGELFIGKTTELPRPSYDPKIEWTDEQVRVRSSGKLWPYRQVGHPRRKVTLSFPCSTDAQWETLRDALGLTSGMGSEPGLLIPTEMELDQALYVNVSDAITVTRGPRTHRVVDVTFEEMPFPMME